MPKYLITYDDRDDRDYERLYSLLVRWRAQHILESVWLANLNGSAKSVIEALREVSAKDDAFVVIELMPHSDWAVTGGIYEVGQDWLNANL